MTGLLALINATLQGTVAPPTQVGVLSLHALQAVFLRGIPMMRRLVLQNARMHEGNVLTLMQLQRLS